MRIFSTFRTARRILLLAVLAAFVLPQIGGLGTITGSVGSSIDKVAGILGISGLVDTVGDALNGVGEGKPTQKQATVVRTVDGDTLNVEFRNGTERSVRLIGLDTPEKYGGEECGALRASAFTRRITEGKAVKLTTDPTQDSVDHYDRLLRYAQVNGRDVAVRVIRAGWAAPYVFDSSNPPRNTDRYRTAADKARSEGRGVWGLCGGNFHSNDPEPWSGD